MRFLSVLFLVCLCSAQTVTVGFSKDKPPYVIEKVNKGFEVELIQEIFKQMGYTVQAKYFDQRRLANLDKMVGVDATATVKKSDNSVLFYSDEYIEFNDFAITLDSDLELSSVADLKGMTVGAWKNASDELGTAFSEFVASSPKKAYHEYGDAKSRILGLWNQNVSVIFSDELIYYWFRLKLSQDGISPKEVKFHDIFKTPTKYRMAFKDKELCLKFNKALKVFKSSGEYKKLREKHIQHLKTN